MTKSFTLGPDSLNMEYDDETIGFQAQPMEEDPEPQTKPLTYDMVSNSAGGYSYAVNDETRFLRYLCLVLCHWPGIKERQYTVYRQVRIFFMLKSKVEGIGQVFFPHTFSLSPIF